MAAAPTASAQESNTTRIEMSGHAKEAPAESSTDSTWYGWQTLLVDAATVPFLVYGLDQQENGRGAVLLLGALGYVLLPPVLHRAHDNRTGGLGSLVLRLVLPIGSSGLGSHLGGCQDDLAPGEVSRCSRHADDIGLWIGVALASGIDIALLSHEKSVRAPRDVQVAVAPMLDAVTRSGGASVHGAF